MSEQKTPPYDMPLEIWGDLSHGASARRTQWVLDHTGEELPVLIYKFALHQEDIRFTSIRSLGKLQRTDPEVLPGVPSSEELKLIVGAGDPLLKGMERPLTKGERQGFLEMWHLKYVSNAINSLNTDELEDLSEEAIQQVNNPWLTPDRKPDIRFIASTVSQALGTKHYQSEEQ